MKSMSRLNNKFPGAHTLCQGSSEPPVGRYGWRDPLVRLLWGVHAPLCNNRRK